MFSELGNWYSIKDCDPRGLALYLRHYSHISKPGRVRRGHTGFAGMGQKTVLLTTDGQALFVWRYQIGRMDGQLGVECSIFRNEGDILSSCLIREAMDIAWRRWPTARLFTFVNASMIRSTNPGYCFQMAGWKLAGKSKSRGLLIFECLPEKF